LQSLTLISFILYHQLKISNASCLEETTIHVDTILYLSLYYLVNDLVHLPNPSIKGRMRQPFLCVFSSFWPFFTRSSVLQCLGTLNEFSSFCLVLKYLIRTIELQSSYPWSFMWSLGLLIYMIFYLKDTKHLWSYMILDKSELQQLTWKQYKNFLKSSNWHLICLQMQRK